MDLQLLHFDDCPNWVVAHQRMQEAAAAVGVGGTIELVYVETPDDAERLGFRGSPTVLINGVDPFAEPDAPVGLSCRIYQTPDGPAGAPTVAQLVHALRAAEPAP